MKKIPVVDKMGEVYKDILAIDFKMSDSFKKLMSKFYDVMRKHGICQGVWSENGVGRAVATPEWNMAYNVFETHIISQWKWAILLAEPPKDLLAYGKQPKIKIK